MAPIGIALMLGFLGLLTLAISLGLIFNGFYHCVKSFKEGVSSVIGGLLTLLLMGGAGIFTITVAWGLLEDAYQYILISIG